jgi:penicillin amidase
MQADTVMIDAEAFVPYILQAFANAQESSVPLLKAFTMAPAVTEAVGRLRSWNFSTPTGIPEGYDAVRLPGNDANSVAATIYAAWRGQFIANTIDKPLTAIGIPVPDGNEALTALRHLLDTFATSHGIGGSGFNFFPVPGVSQPADARDVVILQSLADGLALLAGDSLKDAFHNSVQQDDYRWGLLHRIVFAHPLDSVFSIPPAGGAFPAPLAGLPGIPTDGGFETLDRSDHDVRATTPSGFMFSHGPSNRSVHEGLPGGMRGVSSLPGGVSGVLGSPFYANLLTEWLSNVAYPQLQGTNELQANTSAVLKFVPAK